MGRWVLAVLCGLCLVSLSVSSARAGGSSKASQAAAAASSVGTGVLIRCAVEQAEIFIDGDQVGKTPAPEAFPLKAGEHTVRVARLGFTPFIDVFKVRAGQLTKLDVEIVPISGVLHVTARSEPAAGTATPATPEAAGPAVRVFVDDKYMGQPPLDTELAIGTHAVRIERGGYYPDNFTASAVAGQTVEHEAVLKPLPPDQNPYLKKGPPPTKWYQKWWVWTLGAVGVAAVATAVIVPIVITQRNSLCNNVDVCATESMLTGAPSSSSTAAALTIRF